tara:strand:- start:90 stop:320 length:231 start_codon:yes stop_codon:yes gene_type:complete
MAKIYIDNAKYMGFICDVAHMMVEQSFNIEDIWDDGEYKEDAQIFFDEKYDEVETMLNNTLNIHSNEHFDGDSREV